MLDRLQGSALACALLVVLGLAFTAGASAQSIRLPSTVTPGPIVPVVPVQPPTLTSPSLVPNLKPSLTPSFTPSPVPQLPPVAAPAPAAPRAGSAPVVVRYRCEVVPQYQACRSDGGTPDGGGGEAECDCGRDTCYWNDQGRQVCEKH